MKMKVKIQSFTSPKEKEQGTQKYCGFSLVKKPTRTSKMLRRPTSPTLAVKVGILAFKTPF